MITKEQIEKLKEGDPILIHGSFQYLHADGDIEYKAQYIGPNNKLTPTVRAVHTSFVSLPENGTENTEEAPKNDPCRKFRKGDKVRLIEWNGRKPFDTLHGLKLNPGEVHIVLDDEYDRNEVYIGMSAADEEQSLVHSCHLELVTPVEEVKPYSVRHNEVHAAWSIYGPYGLSAVNYFYGDRYPYSKHSAEAAAYAECDRLNAAHRKEKK